MNVKMKALVAVGAVCFAGAVHPEEVTLFAPGTTMDETALSDAWTCRENGVELRCALGRAEGLQFRGVSVEDVERVYHQGRLMVTTVRFPEARFDSVRGSLEHDFGPGEGRSERLRSGMGATFENAIRVWVFGDHVWLLEQYALRINSSAASWLSKDALDALRRERESGTVNGARNL